MSVFRQINLMVVCAFLLLALIACNTTPEEEQEEIVTKEMEEPKAKQEDTPAQPAPPPPAAVNLDNQIDDARAALRRANLMGANKYFPREYKALVDSLNSVVADSKDYDTGSAMLEGIVIESNKLYDRTLMARKNEYEKSYYASNRALKEIEADRFAGKEHNEIVAMALNAIRLYEAGNLVGAEKQAREALISQASLYTNLSENIRYVDILTRDSENYISDAEDNEAFIYASEELENANQNYTRGRKAFENYNIAESANLLAKAKQNAIIAARVSIVRKKQAETDALLTSTQQKIESASRLRVLDNEGNITESSPWNGDNYLNTNPLVDHSELADDVEFE